MTEDDINEQAEKLITSLVNRVSEVHEFNMIQNEVNFNIRKNGEDIKEYIILYVSHHMGKAANKNSYFFDHILNWFQIRNCQVTICPVSKNIIKKNLIKLLIKIRLWIYNKKQRR